MFPGFSKSSVTPPNGLYLTFLKLWFTQEFIYVEVQDGNDYYCQITWVWPDTVCIKTAGPTKDEIVVLPFYSVRALNPDTPGSQRRRFERLYNKEEVFQSEDPPDEETSVNINS